MALTTTSLNGSLAADATKCNLTSATSVVAGSLLKIDDEYCQVQAISGTWVWLMRGINGSVQCAHNTGAPVVHSATWSDFSGPIPAPRVYSYTSAGALTPAPGIHLVGIGAGGAVAYTLADPAADQTGMVMTIINMSAYAHTIDLATGWGGTDDTDIFTFVNVVGHSITLISRAGTWTHLATSLTAAEGAAAAVA